MLIGMSLGLGLLSKWTYSLFVFPALIVVISRTVLRTRSRDSLRSFSRDKRWGAFSVSLGLILTLVWYLPNTQRIAGLPLSHLLLPVSWFLFSGLMADAVFITYLSASSDASSPMESETSRA